MDNRETLTPSSGDAILKRHLFSEVARNLIKGRGHIERAYFVRRPSRQSFGFRVAASSGPIPKAPGSAGGYLHLDHSYLFIQGPPGTGKTYNAAHAIIALLRAGKRVGVSSKSHKAINKLLGEVEKLAAKAGFRFSGVKKGNKDKPETEFKGSNITTITDSKQAGPQHRLVGGTAFHFCTED